MYRIGCVSYLNAKPLIFGLENQPDIDLQLDVPARLLDGLIQGRFDIALLPTIDYQRMENLSLVPAGGIGSDDETLTVRIFSKVPIASIQSLACDAESHTSVALARIILEESFGIHPEFVAINNDADAQLLIGDKVITGGAQNEFSPSPGTPGEGRGGGHSSFCIHHSAFRDYQLDLGAAWRKLTGLPFLFACWTAREDSDLGDLPSRLRAARENGLANIQTIIRRDAISRGWPVETARKYLTEHLNFEVGPQQLKAVRLFHELAARHGLIEKVKPLLVAEIGK